ncbi:hypothetical protein BC940DRAFT_94344 [Gongronella butleri]|nr:hypothetical protein BC940DRAFT_94344 [Gongronella butleri]
MGEDRGVRLLFRSFIFSYGAMTNLLQSPPLVILGQADIGQVRQYQDDPFTLKAWPKKTVFATTMLEHLCALELLLLRVQRLQTWRMDDQSLIQQVGSAQRAIQSAWHEAGTREITEIKVRTQMRNDASTKIRLTRLAPSPLFCQRQLQEWCAYDLYPLAVASLGYDDTDAEVPRNRNDTSIQAHYHQMSMLSQTLATCQCLLKTISCGLGAKRVSYHLASLHVR